jgi:hypothetical protein
MSHEIPTIPGNEVIDSVESAKIAYRFSHAVTRFNHAAGAILASYEVYAEPTDAQPPIAALRTAEQGEVYTRLSYPEGAFGQIQDIEMDLSYVDSPRLVQE